MQIRACAGSGSARSRRAINRIPVDGCLNQELLSVVDTDASWSPRLAAEVVQPTRVDVESSCGRCCRPKAARFSWQMGSWPHRLNAQHATRNCGNLHQVERLLVRFPDNGVSSPHRVNRHPGALFVCSVSEPEF